LSPAAGGAFFSLLAVVVFGLNLLLLLDYRPDSLGVLAIICRPQPDLRHVG
jgi:hypothetical protein